MSEESRRNSDVRLDKLDDRMDRMEQMMVKIHTALIGNGVPGLIQRHEESTKNCKVVKKDIHSRIDKIDNTLKRIVYGVGGLAAVSLIISVVNDLKSIGVL